MFIDRMSGYTVYIWLQWTETKHTIKRIKKDAMNICSVQTPGLIVMHYLV